MGREQQARLGFRNPIDEPDARKYPVEFLERVSPQLRDKIPTPIRTVQGANRGITTKSSQHRLRAIALDGDGHERANSMLLGLRFEPHGVADDRAISFEARDSVLYGAARDTELFRQRRNRRPRVVAQQSNEFSVDVVHGYGLRETGDGLRVRATGSTG